MEKLVSRIRQRAVNELTRTDHTKFAVPSIGSKCHLDEIAQFESTVDNSLPTFVKKLYLEIGNGGFGPGYGLMSLEPKEGDTNESVLEIYQAFSLDEPEDELWDWPDDLLPLIDWGCAIRSCLDCGSGEIIMFDPNNEVEDMEEYFIPQSDSLESLMSDWCDGVNLWKEIYGD